MRETRPVYLRIIMSYHKKKSTREHKQKPEWTHLAKYAMYEEADNSSSSTTKDKNLLWSVRTNISIEYRRTVSKDYSTCLR